MSGIVLSPKYGLNPTLAVCFWCGNECGDIALTGRLQGDIEAPSKSVIDYEPCDECKHNFARGFTVIEATSYPNKVTSVEIQRGVYPTGRYVVVKSEAAAEIFHFDNENLDKCFVSPEVFGQLFGK